MDTPPSPWAAWERNFVAQMQRLREAREMTQTDLAKRLQTYGLRFHQQTVQRIESGERPVRLNEAHLIAKVLDVGLDVMTDTGETADSEMQFAVDQLRRRSESTADYLNELMGEWIESVEYFASELANRLDATNRPDSDQDVDIQDVDPVAAWGLVWTNKVLDAYNGLAFAFEGLVKISGKASGVRYEEDWERLLPKDDVIGEMATWQDRYNDRDLDNWTLTNPNQLYAEFPGKDIPQTPSQYRRTNLTRKIQAQGSE